MIIIQPFQMKIPIRSLSVVLMELPEVKIMNHHPTNLKVPTEVLHSQTREMSLLVFELYEVLSKVNNLSKNVHIKNYDFNSFIVIRNLHSNLRRFIMVLVGKKPLTSQHKLFLKMVR